LVIGIDDERSCSLSVPGLLGFNQNRPIGEARILEQPPKGFEADEPLADVFVSIDATATRFLRIVPVKDLEAIEADEPFERSERVVIARKVVDVVTRGDQVTRVEANTDTWRAIEVGQYGGEVFEAMSDRASLASRVLEQYLDLLMGPRAERARDRFGDEP